MSKDVYPTKVELRKIAKWKGDWQELLERVQELWHWGAEYCDYEITKDDLGRYIYEWDISTGGWSGNEDIINALSDNFMFWIMCWYSSRVGGHYIFRVEGKEKE